MADVSMSPPAATVRTNLGTPPSCTITVVSPAPTETIASATGPGGPE